VVADRRPLLGLPLAWIKSPSLAVLRVMSPTKTEWYRGRAEDCCRNAIIAEDERRRLHWLEAAARWITLAREEGVLPLSKPVLNREVRDAPRSMPVPKWEPRP
jgi:hypothetical protein